MPSTRQAKRHQRCNHSARVASRCLRLANGIDRPISTSAQVEKNTTAKARHAARRIVMAPLRSKPVAEANGALFICSTADLLRSRVRHPLPGGNLSRPAFVFTSFERSHEMRGLFVCFEPNDCDRDCYNALSANLVARLQQSREGS